MATIVEGKVKEFGEAPYQHDEKNQQSYFVRLDTSSGERELWALGLKDAIESKNIKAGEQVAFADLGIKEGSKRRVWDVERYEPEVNHSNTIEHDTAQDKSVASDKDDEINNDYRRSKYAAIDADELQLPETVQNNYIAKVQNRYFASEKINFYEKGSDDTTIAFEYRSKSLNTSREDAKTIKAMLDVANSKGWSSINIKGTESFKREAWLEANTRGIEVKGYKPTEQDLVELEQRKAERSNNQVIGNEDRSRELNAQKEQETLYTKESDKTLSDHSKDAGVAVGTDAALAVAAGSKDENMQKDDANSAEKLYETQLMNNPWHRTKIDDVRERLNVATQSDQQVLQGFDRKILDMEEQFLNGKIPKYTDFEDKGNEVLSEYSRDQAVIDKYNNPDFDLSEHHLEDKAFEYREDASKDQNISNRELYILEEQANDKYEFRIWQGEDRNIVPSRDAIFQNEVEQHFKQKIEREALMRANEFDAGRDVDPNPNTEVNAEVEQFHDNLAVPSGSNMSHEQAMQKVEAAFDKKINVSQRNEVKELEEKLPNDQKIAVEGWRRIVDERYRDHPAVREQKHEALNAKLPAIVAGEIKLPVPTIDVQERIEIQTRDKGSQDRTR